MTSPWKLTVAVIQGAFCLSLHFSFFQWPSSTESTEGMNSSTSDYSATNERSFALIRWNPTFSSNYLATMIADRPDRKQVTTVIYSIIMTQSSVSPVLCPKSMYQKRLCCWKHRTPNHRISNAGKHQATPSKLNYNIPQFASSAQGQPCPLVKICFAFCNTVVMQAVIITNCTAERLPLSYIWIACFALYGGKY